MTTQTRETSEKRVYRRKVSTPHLDITDIASVPRKDVLDRYINRQITKDKNEFAIFDMAYELGYNVLIEGPTGPGKTMATRAWCAARGLRLARIPSNVGVEQSHLTGRFIPDETGQALGRWVDGTVTHVMRNGGVILINEVNFMPERVSTVMFGVLDDNREIILMDHENEVVRAHRAGGCWCSLSPEECRKRWVLVVADMNPDYEGTRPLNKAFRNRFQIQMYFDYDPYVEQQLIASEALRNLASQLRSDAAKGVYETPVSTNMLMEFERIALTAGYDFARMNFVNHFSIEEKPSLNLVLDTHNDRLVESFKMLAKTNGKPVPWEATDYDSLWDLYGKDYFFEERG